ncbi:MAG: Protein TolB [Gemmatimonadaceae bacterium]|nr:Protein TolB [Gemmatimonadaceae bacterium]
MLPVVFAVILFAQARSATSPIARDPAYASDGRLAVSVDGDLWLRRVNGSWSRLTRGPEWDRQPAWSRDGASLVFASDRSGGGDIYRLPVRGDDASALPDRLTSDDAPESEPALAADGTLFFVRGRGTSARIWSRAPDGSEKRLTRDDLAERWPAISPDGARLAYVQFTETARRLRVRTIASGIDSVVVADRAPARPGWSPDGARIAFFSATPRAGIYVAAATGIYANFLSARSGDPAWSADGAQVLIADRSPDDASYNGDPDRVGDRAIAEQLLAGAGMTMVDAPRPPDAGLRTITGPAVMDRRARNAETFDRFFDRTDRLYFSAPDAAERRAQWKALGDTHRPQALAATSDLELDRVLYRMVRDRPTLRPEQTGRAAVSSASPVATAAGVEILSKGGNVVDAAVAVSFALGVVEPDASGVGGYGEMLVQLTGMTKPALIEFMARVPEEATLSNASLLQDGRYPSDGPVLAMVPGTVAAMYQAWQRFGSQRIPWADLLAPAIRAAKDGYVVSDGLATTLQLERSRFLKYESSRALFFRNGNPLKAGDTLRNPDLAWTLEQIAKNGHDGFYRGEVARRLVNDLRGKGNAIKLTDLSRYFAADRVPVEGTYRGLTIFSSAPPVGGGATLVSQLNLLEHISAPKRYTDDAQTLHAMIGAWQLIPSSRNRIADPSLWPVNVEPFQNKDTADARWKCFDADRALTPAIFKGDTLSCAGTKTPAEPARDADETPVPECEGQPDHAAGAICRPQGTTAFTVADADGNAVAVTQTLGTWGGNFYVTSGLGFLYNDKLTSYGTDPNAYGARLPYARHGSTIAPTIVMQGSSTSRRPILAVGAAGNAWINSAVYQTLVGVVDFGLSPQRALELPRFLPSQRGGGGFGPPAGPGGRREFVIDIEDGFDPDVIATLRAMGHNFNVISLRGELRMGYGAAIAIGSGRVTAGGDPRRSGTASAIP